MKKLTNKYSVLTKNGFKKFEGIKKTTRSDGKELFFDDCTSIKCTPEHRFLVGKYKHGMIFRKAKNINIGNKVQNKKVIKIDDINQTLDYFDLLNVKSGNHYITSGVTSHNCAFIRPNIWDEFADSIFPAQSGLAWKKNIIISTSNGMNHFYHMVKGAKEETNGKKLFEVNWKDVPRYNSDGSLMKPEEFQGKIIQKHGHLYFNQNYGCEFLGSSHTLINSDALKAMKPGEIIEKRDGKLNIYEYPKIGHKYFMTVDAAKDGRDFFSVQIVDVTEFTFKQVATAKLQIDYLLMPEFLNEWCELYNKPYLIIENNEGAGQSIADQMKNDYEYENLHSDKDGVRNRKKKYPGFRTTTKSRRQILQTMKLFIENNKLEVIDKDTIREFYQFILINNKFQADEGSHDDMIMSLAMVFVPFTNTKNFEDMKSVVNQLYNEEIEDADKLSYGDVLVIGDFQDSVDEVEETKKKMWNGYIVYEEGDLFI